MGPWLCQGFRSKTFMPIRRGIDRDPCDLRCMHACIAASAHNNHMYCILQYHTCIYVYIHIYIYTYTYMYTSRYIYMLCLCISIHIYIYICICIYTYTCILYVCVYICICIHLTENGWAVWTWGSCTNGWLLLMSSRSLAASPTCTAKT